MKKQMLLPALAITILAAPAWAQDSQGSLALPETIRPFLADILANHPRTATLSASMARARADANAADQPLYNPELEFDATPVVSSPPDSDLSTAYTASVRLAVDISGKRDLRARIGTAQAQAAEADAQAVQADVVTETLSALAGVQTARQRVDLAAKQVELANTFLDISARRQKAGELPAIDFSTAQMAAAEANRAREEADLALVQAEETLRAACFCAIEKVPSLPATLPPSPRFSEPQIEAIIDAKPEVLAARRQIDASRQTLDLARAQRVPDPTFRLGGSSEGEERRVLVGFSIPLPVLNSGSAEVIAAGRALTQAELQERQTVQENAAAIRAASRSYQRARQGDETWQRQAIPLLETQTALLGKLWRVGELSATDFLVQMRETARVNAAAVEIRATAWDAFARLFKAVNTTPFAGNQSHD
ncbi:TolC family protein [Magnetospirillum molischianum]|uniref:Outer membrane protein n=1 Tax=Magnetospirillum molischianum DSM 120 TaxID=1150626 RepID=H8FPZ8_MAGML|nr:TolC family protein [Magnetospirillum molischianum]CCG40436.1 exported hypothetical protein [Magnetospirillum molischianum DSM 120]